MSASSAPSSRDDRAAIDKAMSLLAAFGGQAEAGIGVSELARRADLSKSTAFRVLNSLERNGVVERVGSQYRLGARLFDIGRPVHREEDEFLRDVLTPFLIELYEATHETVHLAVLRGADVVYLNKLYGQRQHPCPTRIGGKAPAYCTAVGKALLAYDADAIEATLARGLRAWTSKTVRDADQLRSMLAQVRAEALAFDDEEVRPGLSCLAVPVLGPGNVPVAAFSVAGATGRLKMREQAAALRRISYAARRALAAASAGGPRLQAV